MGTAQYALLYPPQLGFRNLLIPLQDILSSARASSTPPSFPEWIDDYSAT